MVEIVRNFRRDAIPSDSKSLETWLDSAKEVLARCTHADLAIFE
jgi:hypothetical protein